ncbi:MAG: hypothetical protein EP349_04705 [Alphaproteobacteria bacterium]|nr:MAG: hypothetical protein EP349_04705 [Alphaproteobacteria bacterium]
MSASKDPKPLVIVYHADCIDGAACAWGVSKAWGVDTKTDHNTTYIPYGHHDTEEAERKIRAALKPDAEVYFVDVAPNPALLDELMTPDDNGKAKAEAVHVLDHHKSAAGMLKDYAPPETASNAPRLEILIDESKTSAARMVWEHVMPDEPVPPVLDVINLMDGDAAGLTTPMDFAAAALIDTRDISNIDRALIALRGLAKLTFNDMAKKGKFIAADQNTKINKLLANAQFVTMQLLPDTDPIAVPVVNGDVKQFGRQVSERLVSLGKQTGSGVAFAWFMQKNGSVSMSIRTDGSPDAQLIADHLKQTMGVTGGGHAGAGAVHFSSLFEFSRQMPFHLPQQTEKEAAATKRVPKQPPAIDPGKYLH